MFRALTLTNFLSFGPGPQTIELAPLNVLVGANGSGKSNVVEALSVLRAVPRDLQLPIREGGGVEDWLWQDGEPAPHLRAATLAATFLNGQIAESAVRYRLEFASEGGTFVVLDERIENLFSDSALSRAETHFLVNAGPINVEPFAYFGYERGQPTLRTVGAEPRPLAHTNIDRTQSILSQRRDPESYPEVAAVGDRLKEILIYRAWSFGPNAPIRRACSADVPSGMLLEDFSNLPARVMALKRHPPTKKRLLELLSDVAPGFSDVEVALEGVRLQLYLTEGARNVPAHRLSDGTLRYLALLTILLDPGPARLVVLEEPELGLHPDVLPTLRDLFLEGSRRFQLVVTTHSVQLLDALNETPEAVVVCEKAGATSSLRRLVPEEVDRLREFGSLGTLWLSGQLGGTRW